MRDGLYYLDDDMAHVAAAVLSQSSLQEFLLHHRRLGHISFNTLDLNNEIGGDKGEEDNVAASRNMIIGVIPARDMYNGEDEGTSEAEQDHTQGEQQEYQPEGSRWPQDLQVYSRRHQVEKDQVQEEEDILLSQSPETQGHSNIQESNTSPSASDGIISPPHDDLDLPITLRKQPHTVAGKSPSHLSQYDVFNYVSYLCMGPQYKAFIAAPDSTLPIPRNWQEAKQYPEWRKAMMEEMEALDKNNTWVLTILPPNKRIVGCKWVFTVKQNTDGKVERYKARLVAKGYSQTYGVDYDETFAPVTKMNTIRAVISIAANNEWKLFQMDVKNAFLHGDLHEEVYMEISPGFNSRETNGKVCRLRKSLYGLKQSPRAWFGRFRKEVCSMGYQQSNADHTLFFKHQGGKIVILIVYVDDIVITGSDDDGIACLKKMLAKSFEVKDLGFLHYFLGIEVVYGPQEMASKVDLRGVRDAKGNTALHCAASRGCLESCRFLVEESGIDVNSVSKTGETPLSYAAQEGNVQVMRYLLHRGADPATPDERGSTPLHDAALEGHCEAVRLLLSKGVPVDPVDYRGAPLHLAVSNDHVEVVKVLLEHSADPNKVANKIFSPVLVACYEKSLKCIKLLIEAGADLNAPGYPAPTPLMQAVNDGLIDFVKLLLEAGADPNIPNQHGAIPIEQAADQDRHDLVEVLFPRTKPIPYLPDWSVDGIIRTVNSRRINPLQDAVSVEERIAYWKSRGMEAFAKEDYFNAMYFYSMVTIVDPLDATIFANLSLCWLRLRNGDQALEAARKCRTVRPRWSKAWYREGAALSFMKDYKGAAGAFREALQLSPKSEEIREALRKAEKAAAGVI